MYVPPWLSQTPSDFVKAAEAGARLGISISENETRANLERMKLEADKRGGGMPSIRGGIKLPVAEPVAPKGVHIGGIPGSPMLIDPARENQAPVVNQPFSLPGDASGNKFVSSPSGEVVDYVAPPNLSKPFGGQQAGYFQLDPESGEPVQIIPGSDKAATEQKYQVPIMQGPSGGMRAMAMTPDQLDSKWDQLPEFARTNTISQLVRNIGRDKAVAKPAAPQPNGTRVRNKTTGQTATWVNGKLVPDEAEGATPVAEENPYSDLGLPVGSGFLHMGQNYEVPAR